MQAGNAAELGKLARGVITACSDGAEKDEAKWNRKKTREEAKEKEATVPHRRPAG